MYILIDKETQRIKSFSDDKIIYDKDRFDLIQEADEDLSGNECYYRDNKIEKKPIVPAYKVTQADIDNATTIDELKNIIKDLIK